MTLTEKEKSAAVKQQRSNTDHVEALKEQVTALTEQVVPLTMTNQRTAHQPNRLLCSGATNPAMFSKIAPTQDPRDDALLAEELAVSPETVI